ncbi:MAG: polyphenol oxidase family protein [Planctomycetes bacterium]|nr:polyphenol oxidase family protein [Planctomycetota bacterium]
MSAGRDVSSAFLERQIWCRYLSLSVHDLVVPGLVHGDNLIWVDQTHRGRGANNPDSVVSDADGLITQTPRLALAVTVGDCGSAILFQPTPIPTMAVIHAGWRGLSSGILSKAVETVCQASQGCPSTIKVGLGPQIGWECFPVGAEVAELTPRGARTMRNGHWYVSLDHWAQDQLLATGVQGSNVESSQFCTRHHADWFFSHRGQGVQAGRMGLFAALGI